VNERCILLSAPNDGWTFCDKRPPVMPAAIAISDLDWAMRGGVKDGTRLCAKCVEKIIELLRAARDGS
jgi:hypothetical protein